MNGVIHMPKVVVVREHRSNYPNPVSFSAVDRLLVGERDTEYVGWVKITDKKGRVGWHRSNILSYLKMVLAELRLNSTQLKSWTSIRVNASTSSMSTANGVG